MSMRVRGMAGVVVAGPAAWAGLGVPARSAADLVAEEPEAVATLSVSQAVSPSPIFSLARGGALLQDDFEGRSGGSYASSAVEDIWLREIRARLKAGKAVAP